MLLTQHGAIAAMGKVESCIFSLERQRPQRLSAVEFPEGVPEEIPNRVPDFIPLEKTAEGMTEAYIRTVRYSDLDKNNHMTNLRYIDMFQDACDQAFWAQFSPPADGAVLPVPVPGRRDALRAHPGGGERRPYGRGPRG